MRDEKSPAAAEVELPCSDLDRSLRFFREVLGFRLDAIAPADDPGTARLSGHGLRLRLQRGSGAGPGVLRLSCDDPDALAGGQRELVAPNGTRVLLELADAPLDVPPLAPSFVVTRAGAEAEWRVGRAGMRYRDLIPDRQGGRFVASHIRIDEGGPVPDYVHHHRVRFQLIYCRRGWVRVVYEDQGPPFELRPGDCVLQPPGIRHRVLGCSDGLEVVEVSSPAEHETLVDHDLELPTAERRPERAFGGQRFVRHVAADAAWGPWRCAGFEARDLGVAAATHGLAGARVVRPVEATGTGPLAHDGELWFACVLAGALELRVEGELAVHCGAGDAFVVPAGRPYALAGCTGDLELLEVTLPRARSA